MSTIARRLADIRATLPHGVGLVAVSKFHPVEQLRQAYDAGQRAFGESRVQEVLAKIPELPDDVCWHFIGHLQSNKVRALLGTRRIALIESVDTEALLERIDAESLRAGIVSRVLMQVHVAAEETKFGFAPGELLSYFAERRFEGLKATHICGVMGMATNTDDASRVRADFGLIADIFHRISAVAPDLRGFDILSMGMSDDYPLAIEAGANLVRIGSSIFGPRSFSVCL